MKKYLFIIVATSLFLSPFVSAATFISDDEVIDLRSPLTITVNTGSGGGNGTADGNASSICSGVEVLLGNGSCQDSGDFFDGSGDTFNATYDEYGSYNGTDHQYFYNMTVLDTDTISNETDLALSINTTANIEALGFSTSSVTDTNETVRVSIIEPLLNLLIANVSSINTTANIEALGFVTGAHTVDTNETVRFEALAGTDCTGDDKVTGVDANGNLVCGSDVTGAGGKGTDGFYLYNTSGTILFNETQLNATIAALDTDTTIPDTNESTRVDALELETASINTTANIEALGFSTTSVTDTNESDRVDQLELEAASINTTANIKALGFENYNFTDHQYFYNMTVLGGDAFDNANVSYLNNSNTWTDENSFMSANNYFAGNIIHQGDADTYMVFNSDQISWYAGGVQMFNVQESGLDTFNINPGYANVDFYIRDDAGDVIFHTDADTGNIGINKSNAATELDVDGTVTAVLFDGSIDCSDIIGGSDGDYCADADTGGTDTNETARVEVLWNNESYLSTYNATYASFEDTTIPDTNESTRVDQLELETASINTTANIEALGFSTSSITDTNESTRVDQLFLETASINTTDNIKALGFENYNFTDHQYFYNMTVLGGGSSTDTNASTECSGTTTYLDGEGNCDDISSVYEGDLSNEAGLYAALSDVSEFIETNDAATLTTLNTGQGANELFDMNQNVQTSDFVTFEEMSINNTGGAAVSRVTRTDGKTMAMIAGTSGTSFGFDSSASFNIVAYPESTLLGTSFSGGTTGLSIDGASGQVDIATAEITSNLSFGDDDKTFYGASNDAEIYWDNSGGRLVIKVN